MIKTLIFDLGRVLVDFDFHIGYGRMAALNGLSPDDVKRKLRESQLVVPFECGHLSSAEFAKQVSGILGVSMTEDEFGAIWCSVFEPGPIVPAEFLAELHRRYRMVLLSNTNQIHYVALRAALPALNHFDAMTLSYEVGAMKPDEKIYRDAIAKAQCAPEECFYTDDIEAYVEGARAVGINGFVFHGFEQLKCDLESAGVTL
jgi:putative hydrolase of the HAD superfamily